MSIRILKKFLRDIENHNYQAMMYYCTEVCDLYLIQDNLFSCDCLISQLIKVDPFERHCIIAGILKSIKYIK